RAGLWIERVRDCDAVGDGRGGGQVQEPETVVVGVVSTRLFQQRVSARLRQREQPHVTVGVAVDKRNPSTRTDQLHVDRIKIVIQRIIIKPLTRGARESETVFLARLV